MPLGYFMNISYLWIYYTLYFT